MSQSRYETEVQVAVPTNISSEDAARHISALLNSSELIGTGAIPSFINGLTFKNKINGYELKVHLISGVRDGDNWLDPVLQKVDSRETATGFEEVEIW